MLPGLNKPLRHCSPSDLLRHSEGLAVRQSISRRKYSLGLLEEAYKLSRAVGVKEAARQAEVNREVLQQYIQSCRRQAGLVKRSPRGMPVAKKIECLNLARRLHREGRTGGMRKCWIKAGQMMGINGRSVEFQYVRGFFNETET